MIIIYAIDRRHKRILYLEDGFKHHGITGQKWGVITRNVGVNYIPIGRRMTNKEKLEAATNLFHDMDSRFEYGVKIGNKRYYNMYDVDFSKYRTTPIKDLEKDPIGVCWDFTNYTHSKLNDLGIPNSNYMFVRQFPDGDLQTHTFTLANIGDKNYWIEVANAKFCGVNEVDSYKDVVSKLLGGTKDSYDIYEYNPDGMDMRLKNGEYFEKATSNLLETNQIGNYSKLQE